MGKTYAPWILKEKRAKRRRMQRKMQRAKGMQPESLNDISQNINVNRFARYRPSLEQSDRDRARQIIYQVGERLSARHFADVRARENARDARLLAQRNRQLQRHNIQPARVVMQRSNVQELINQVRNRGNNNDIDFQVERGDNVDRSNCKDMLYCRRKTKAKYKNNRQNRQLGRVGQNIVKWVLTKNQ